MNKSVPKRHISSLLLPASTLSPTPPAATMLVTAKSSSAQAEFAQVESAQVEFAQVESARADSVKAKFTKPEATQAKAARMENAQAEAARPEPTGSTLGAKRKKLKQLPQLLGLLLALSATTSLSFLSGCVIEADNPEAKNAEVKLTQEKEAQLSEVDRFILAANRCIAGDLSGLDKLVATYTSSYTKGVKWNDKSFIYQQIKPTQAFEKCAQKASRDGNRSAFNQMYIKQGRIARIARFFYATNQPTEGAFWLQRLVNVKGEMDGLEIAGRLFIQDTRTIAVGVRLLEQSARLGNRNARQLLMGLMNPGSLYYQQITKNNLVDDDGESQDDSSASTDTNANQTNSSASAAPHSTTNSSESSTSPALPHASRSNPESARVDTAPNMSTAGPRASTVETSTSTARTSMSTTGTSVTPVPPSIANSQATLEAISQDDSELDMPLELYEQRPHSPSAAAGAAARTAVGTSVGTATGTAAGATSATSNEPGTTSGYSAAPSNVQGQGPILNPQEQNLLENEERLKAIQERANRAAEAAQRLRERANAADTTTPPSTNPEAQLNH